MNYKKVSVKIDRLQFLLKNAINYIAELKEDESEEDRQEFFADVIGLDEEELKYYGI